MKQTLALMAVVLVFAACRGHERSSITGSYGSNFLTGQVSMADGMANPSPAGVVVSVRGTGMSTTLAADGTFAFAGVPENAQLDFTRSDVNAHFAVASGSGPLSIELSATNAQSKGGKRHAAAPPPWIQFEGKLKSVGTNSIVVTDEHLGDITILVDKTTMITQGNKTLQLSDLKSGEQVHVMAETKGTDKLAVRIMVQDENEPGDDQCTTMTANGTVTAVGSGQFTVHTEDHGDVVVKYDSSTIVRRQGQTITGADIKVGDQVNAMGTKVDDHTLQAKQIEVRGIDQNQEVHGTVTQVGTSSIMVAGVTINVDSSTVIKKKGQNIALSDIKVGDQVEAEGTRVDANTLLARQITVEDDD